MITMRFCLAMLTSLVVAGVVTPCPATTLDVEPLIVVADIVQFRQSETETRWEFQYAFADTSLRFVLAPDGFQAEMRCSLELVSERGDTIRDEWIAGVSSTVQRPEHRMFYTGIRPLRPAPGTYKVTFVAYDVNNEVSRISSTFSTTVRLFSLRPTLSDLMFVMPNSAGEDARFVRNTVLAVPNPRREVIGTDPSICVYAEIYNTNRNNIDTMALEFIVFDNVRQEQLTAYLRRTAVADGLVLREEIPAGALVSGVYTLQLRLMSNDLATVYETLEKRFFILNPELPPEGKLLVTEDEQFQASEWAVATGDRLKLELELSDVIATNAEKQMRSRLSDERSQQRYLFRFWRMRDPDGTTDANERLDEFREMYTRAQKFYSNPVFRDGWRTDRGVALLRWGIPTQVEQFIQTMDTKPYEIWFYQAIQGGVYCYFVDYQMLQNHRLVHSTMIGQVREQNWYNIYAKAFQPNPNSIQSLQPSQR